MTKDEQRKEIRQVLASMTNQERQVASSAICTHLTSIASVATADTLLAYLPLPDEVDLSFLLAMWIEESRIVCVPVVAWEDKTMRAGLLASMDDKSIIKGRYGLREPSDPHPVPADTIDVMLVPGLGFDVDGGRLGRGAGYYDRFLATHRAPVVIGVGFDSQVLDSIQREKHDQLMTAVVTPSGILVN